MSSDSRGLLLTVYRPADFPGCTNGGLSGTAPRLTLVGVVDIRSGLVVPLDRDSRVFPVSAAAPPVWARRVPGGGPDWCLVPAMPEGRDDHRAVQDWLTRWMHDGNYATGDSRFDDLVGSHNPVAIHDRTVR